MTAQIEFLPFADRYPNCVCLRFEAGSEIGENVTGYLQDRHAKLQRMDQVDPRTNNERKLRIGFIVDPVGNFTNHEAWLEMIRSLQRRLVDAASAGLVEGWLIATYAGESVEPFSGERLIRGLAGSVRRGSNEMRFDDIGAAHRPALRAHNYRGYHSTDL
jgi:hypothetical protein